MPRQPKSSSQSVVLASDGGLPIEADAAWATLVDGVEFNSTTGEYNSTALDVSAKRGVRVLLDIESAGSPTSIRFKPEFTDDDGVTYWGYEYAHWAAMYFEDTETAAGLKREYPLDVAGIDKIRFGVTAEDVTTTDKFTASVHARAYR